MTKQEKMFFFPCIAAAACRSRSISESICQVAALYHNFPKVQHPACICQGVALYYNFPKVLHPACRQEYLLFWETMIKCHPLTNTCWMHSRSVALLHSKKRFSQCIQQLIDNCNWPLNCLLKCAWLSQCIQQLIGNCNWPLKCIQQLIGHLTICSNVCDFLSASSN